MTVPDLHTDEGPNRQRLCGAKTRQGTPCRGWAMLNGRCRMHGGKSLRGTGSPTYKHGLYSKDVFTRLGAVQRNAPDVAHRLLFDYTPREAVQVALVYRREGKEAAIILMHELFIRRLERKYGSVEAAYEAISSRARRTRL